MSTELPKLTTTSYAVLGLLAIKPWTTYELIQQMGRGIDRLWPRSRSKLFEEPKKLVVRGLAQASAGLVGRRARTEYAITGAGRRELAAWLATTSQPPALESEHLLKVFFAEHGTKEDLKSSIDGLREWAAHDLAVHATVARTYLAGLGPFPERAPILALTARYLVDFAEMTQRWAEWANTVVESWPTNIATAEPDWATFHATANLPNPSPPQPRSREHGHHQGG
jgi:DNA-binding PadR family transcriptional regulator